MALFTLDVGSLVDISYHSNENDQKDAYNKIKQWLSDTKPAPDEIVGVFLVLEQGSCAHVTVSLATLEHMASVVPRVIEGPWENVLRLVVRSFVNFTDMTWCTLHLDCTVTYKTKFYIVNILSSPSLCSNPYLRLEIVGLICRLGFDGYNYHQSKLTEGIIKTMAEINMDLLELHLGNHLIFNASHLNVFIRVLYRAGHLSEIGDRILLQLRENNPGREVCFLLNIIKLIGRVSQTVSNECSQDVQEKDFNLFSYILLLSEGLKMVFNDDSFRNSRSPVSLQYLTSEKYNNLCFLKPLVKLREASHHHILLPHITYSIAEITHSILSTHFQILSTKDPLREYKIGVLIRNRNKILNDLNLPTGRNKLPSMLLQWQHGRYSPHFKCKFTTTVSTFKFDIDLIKK